MSRKRLRLKAETPPNGRGDLQRLFPAIRVASQEVGNEGTSKLPSRCSPPDNLFSSNYVKLVPNFIMKHYFQMKSACRKSIVKFFK